MRIIFSSVNHLEKFNVKVQVKDIIFCNTLFSDMEDVYGRVISEVSIATEKYPWFWKDYHQKAHMIAGGCKYTFWKKQCPVFQEVVDRMRNFFRFNIKASRLNWYRDQKDWKPYHHDSPALNKKKFEGIENITIGASFGCERQISFMENKSKKVITFPL